MREEPKITVIMPVYNALPYLREGFASLLAQTFPLWELILVDDGSTDGSGALGDTLAKEDGRVRVLHQKNAGVSAARNAGLAAAAARYVLFMDADDTAAPEMLAALYTAAEKANADAVLCRFARVLPDGTRLAAEPFLRDVVFRGDEVRQELLYPLLGPKDGENRTLEGSVCRILLRREYLKENEIRFAPLFLSEDFVFAAQCLAGAERAAVCGRVLYEYRMRPSSAVHSLHPGALAEQKRALDLVRAICRKEKVPEEEWRPRLAAHYLSDSSVEAKKIVACEPTAKTAKARLKSLCRQSEARQALESCRWRRLAFPLNLFCLLLRWRQAGPLGALIRVFLRRQKKNGREML